MRTVLLVLVVIVLTTFAIEAWNAAVEEAECLSFSKTTGYWVKYDRMNGCFVLIDNQYLVHKDALVASDRPAFNPDIGDEAFKPILEN